MMLSHEYPIPSGFHPLPNPDVRSDEEIAKALQQHRPVTSSDKNVWAFWHSGWSGMRHWCRRNVVNWVRRLGPEWTVRVLDAVEGSPSHYSRFVPASYLPQAFQGDVSTVQAPPQHISDVIRLPLLLAHGGVWMDAGMLLLRHLDDICWRAIESPSSPYEMAGVLMPLRPEEGTMLNGFIAARRDNPMVRRWHSVYSAMWQGRSSSAGFGAHPLLAHLPQFEVQTDKLQCPPLLIPGEALGDYLAHFVAFERLHSLRDPSDGFDGAEYHASRILKLRAVDHLYYAQRITGWDGRRQFDLLCTRVDDVQANLHAPASDFVSKVISNSALLKLSHGPPCGLENLASIWDEERHADDDVAPGSFAHYLRHASAFWDLDDARVQPATVEKKRRIFDAGVLEPIPPCQKDVDNQGAAVAPPATTISEKDSSVNESLTLLSDDKTAATIA